MIRSSNLRFSYSDKQFMDFPELVCENKESLLIIGESGKGKTTLLHLLGGLLTPHSGNIFIGVTDITKMNTSKRDLFRGQKIGIIFQRSHFIDSLTVLENLLLCQKLAGIPKNKQAIENVSARLNITDKLNQKAKRLSQGEQQRAAIARALLNKPELILADEPTSILDDKNATVVYNMLKEQAEYFNSSLIIVTHDQRLKDQIKKQIEL